MRGKISISCPPPIVALLVAVAMWKIAKVYPLLDVSLLIRKVTAGVLLLTGGAIAPPGFVALIRARTTFNNRFQIKPEERALAVMFGTAYAEYKGGVRRWL
jgi:protein-S-isoprenylcysteine O-methyltransferase Ste14